MGLEKICPPGIGCLATIAVIMAPIGIYIYAKTMWDNPSPEKIECREKYQSAIYDYGDTNKDGKISKEEMNNFDREILKAREVILDSNSVPKYKDGKQVPYEVISKWIDEYVQNRKSQEINKK